MDQAKGILSKDVFTNEQIACDCLNLWKTNIRESNERSGC